MRGGTKFFELFNSDKFAIINPFLKPQVYESIAKTAASTLRDKEPTLNSHFSGAWINYKKFSIDSGTGLFKYENDLVTTTSVFSKMTNPHPALVYLPPWLNDKLANKGLEYWLNNASEYVELSVNECLKDGIDPAYLARGAALRLFFFTLSKGFNKWCLEDGFAKAQKIKEASYDSILLPNGSELDIKLTVHPLVLDTLELSIVNKSNSNDVQYINTVPVDVPLNCFRDLNFETGRLKYYDLKSFYDNKAKEAEFFDNYAIKQFYCGFKNELPFSQSVKNSVSLNYSSGISSFEVYSCNDVVFSNLNV